MYTRIVEFTTKPGKASELCDAINDKVLSILKTPRARASHRTAKPY